MKLLRRSWFKELLRYVIDWTDIFNINIHQSPLYGQSMEWMTILGLISNLIHIMAINMQKFLLIKNELTIRYRRFQPIKWIQVHLNSIILYRFMAKKGSRPAVMKCCVPSCRWRLEMTKCSIHYILKLHKIFPIYAEEYSAVNEWDKWPAEFYMPQWLLNPIAE
jgi:hypothetical protein